MAVRIHRADHMTTYLQKLALTPQTSGGCSFGIVHSQTTVTQFESLFLLTIIIIIIQFNSLLVYILSKLVSGQLQNHQKYEQTVIIIITRKTLFPTFGSTISVGNVSHFGLISYSPYISSLVFTHSLLFYSENGVSFLQHYRASHPRKHLTLAF
jgi:hypothetical protein